MPLLGQLRIDRLQTVVPAHLPSGAIRTTLPPVSIVDGGLPLVALTTNPPDLFGGIDNNMLRRQRPVFSRVPFF